MKSTMTGIEFNELPYERTEMKHVISVLKNPKVIIDVGANIGWWSITLAKVFPKCKIIAFEPMLSTQQYLLDNILNNKLYNQISVYDWGLSDKSKSIKFYFYPDLPAASSIKNLQKNLKKVTAKVLVMPLDNLEFKKIDFIKIDTEGSELKVLQGGKNTIKLCHPIIMCEMLRKWTKEFGYHPNDIIKFLKQFDYKCYAMGRKLKLITEITDDTEETNFLFK